MQDGLTREESGASKPHHELIVLILIWVSAMRKQGERRERGVETFPSREKRGENRTLDIHCCCMFQFFEKLEIRPFEMCVYIYNLVSAQESLNSMLKDRL